MGFKDNLTNKAVEEISKNSQHLFNDLIRIQESMHAHLEKILEVQRMTYDEIRALRKSHIQDDMVKQTKWKDEFQR